MGKKILIVDDSALMRRVISDIIKSRSEYDVPDIARDGLEGFEKITTNPTKYDAIIMDINMPKMSGLEVLEKLQKYRVKHKTIVVSTVAKEGAEETIRALELGALDFVTKPVVFADVTGDDFNQTLIKALDVATNGAKVEVLGTIGTSLKTELQSEQKKSSQTATRTEPKKTVEREITVNNSSVSSSRTVKGSKLVALCCSTGGPKSLQDVIPRLPANMDAPMVLVQHMPKGFTNSLAQRLNEISNVIVSEAQEGDILEKGHVYIAPGGRHMEIQKVAGEYKIRINDNPPVDALRPCANVMYNSLVDSDFEEITCVVLTGMGADGTKGIKNLASKRKVHVISQDEASCVVYGMPKAIKEAGLSDEVWPLNDIADAIIKNVGVS